MYNQLYPLFRVCFPNYPVTETVFNRQLRPDLAQIISRFDGDQLIGYSLIHQNSISLLCVDPHYRNQGIGSHLLKLSEEMIAQTGAQSIVLGRSSHYLFQGVPADEPSAQRFFEHRGYSAQWVSANMALQTAEYDPVRFPIPPAPRGLQFRIATEEDRPSVLQAVADVHENWVRYYKSCTDPIILAILDGKIVGFEIVEADGGIFGNAECKVGAFGCVGVIQSARERGIGRQMVARAIEWLKSQGCDTIHLRYVELVDWYGRLGFRIVGQQWMEEKEISANRPASNAE
ncbi:MAG: GNAT family N-acetyltransferase [Clostridia bacterium]|nr:GNAT family N-acetyltransferase [Clostridia bacterium]